MCVYSGEIYTSIRFMTLAPSNNFLFNIFFLSIKKTVTSYSFDTLFSFFFVLMLRCQIFVEALYYSYNVMKTEVEKEDRKIVYVYNDFDTTSMYLIIKRQGYLLMYFISFFSLSLFQGTTDKLLYHLLSNCDIIRGKKMIKIVSYVRK